MTHIWIVQNHPKLLDVNANLAEVLDYVEKASKEGADLIIFPECVFSGYMINTNTELEKVAEPIPGPSINKIIELCERYSIYAALGMLEKRENKYFNSAVLLGPKGFIFKYSKSHLSGVGADKLVSEGDRPFEVADTPFGKLGLLICYDIRFPEASRCLALKGCQLILNISNWPKGAEVNPNLFIKARAAENNVYVIGANRVGSERGIEYIGSSAVINPDGKCIVKASNEEKVIKINLDIRNLQPGIKYLEASNIKLNIFKDRRPDLYKCITNKVENF